MTEARIGILRGQAFTAAGEVTWTVQEGAAGGSVDDKGKYVAPEKAGVYHVVATDKANPSVTSTATVTVVPLGMNLVVGRPGGPGTIDGNAQRARFRAPEGVAYIRRGNGEGVVIADTGNRTIRKFEKGTVTTVAGTPGETGTVDGVGPAAKFDRPTTIVADEGGGRVFVLEQNANCIRKVDIDTGAVTTFAGTCGVNGHQDSTGNTGATALFGRLDALVFGSQGDALYACEIDTFRGIRRIDAKTGRVTSPVTGINNGCSMAADTFSKQIYFNDNNNTNDVRKFADPLGGPIPPFTQTSLCPGLPANYFSAMATITGVGGANDIYAFGNNTTALYRCNITKNEWAAVPFAGALGDERIVDGPLGQARFSRPTALSAYAGGGALFVTDEDVVRRINTFAGSGGTIETYLGSARTRDRVDGPRPAARLTAPTALIVDDAGNTVIADSGFDQAPNNTLRRFDNKSATLTTLSGVPSTADLATPPSTDRRIRRSSEFPGTWCASPATCSWSISSPTPSVASTSPRAT